MTKTKKELYTDILKVIMKIDEQYPELTKYINEMNISNVSGPEVEREQLIAYYDSLNALFTSFSEKQNQTKQYSSCPEKTER